MAGRQRDDAFLIQNKKAPPPTNRASTPTLDERCKGRFNVADAGNIENDELLPGRFRSDLHIVSLYVAFRAQGLASMPIVPLALSWRKSSSRFVPNTLEKKTTPVTLPAGPVEAGHKAVPDRVASTNEDNWHCCGCSLRRAGRGAIANSHGHRPTDQFGRHRR